jgi:hypothetical protein
MFSELFSKWLKRLNTSTRKQEHRRKEMSCFRPLLEMLEDRITPAHLNIVSGGGSADGSVTVSGNGYGATYEQSVSLGPGGFQGSEELAYATTNDQGYYAGPSVDFVLAAGYLVVGANPGINGGFAAQQAESVSTDGSCLDQIVPDGSEQIGDPVLVQIDVSRIDRPPGTSGTYRPDGVTYSDSFNYSVSGATGPVIGFTDSNGGGETWVGHIGDLIDISSHVSANMSGPLNGNNTIPYSGTNDTEIKVNLAPVTFSPDAGGPYTIADGNSLTLDASHTSNPNGLPLSYYWDVNVNGSWINAVATGQTPTLSPSELQSHGITAANSPYLVRVEAVDSSSGTIVISRTTTLTVQSLADSIVIQPYSGPYDGNPHGISGTAMGAHGENLSNLLNLGATYIDAGHYTVNWNFAGNNDYPPDSGTSTIDISQATPTVAVNPVSVPYDGNPHETTGEAFGVNGEELFPVVISYTTTDGGAPVDAGSYTATGTFAGNQDYTSATGTNTIAISQAPLTINVGNLTKTYGQTADFSSLPTTVDGVNGETLDISYASAGVDSHADVLPGGGYPITATVFDDTGKVANYAVSVNNGTLIVQPATAFFKIDSYSEPYDGNPHGISGTATGVLNEDLSNLLNLGATYVDAGHYTVNWTFTGNNDYLPDNGTSTVDISAVRPTANINPVAARTYNGMPHGTTGQVLGVNNVVLNSIVVYTDSQGTELPGGAPVHAGTYTATVSYPGNVDYLPASASTSIVINQADAVINVPSIIVPYDGYEHVLTGTATGVQGEDLSAQLEILNGTSIEAGLYGIPWVFNGINTDYNDASGVSFLDITKAPPTASINPVAPTTYDGHGHGTTGQVLGVNGPQGTIVLSNTVLYTDSQGNVLIGAPVNAGTYTATVSYPGDNDYTPASASTSIVIIPATLTVSGITANNKVYDGQATATIHKGSAVLVGVVSGDIGAVTLHKNGATGTFADKNAGIDKTVTVSGLTISGTKAGNYVLVQPTTTATITPKTLTVTGIAATSKVYDGNTNDPLITSGATLVGVITADIGTVTLNTSGASGIFPNANVGTDKRVTVAGLVIGGADAGNYVLAPPTGLTADISKASPSFSNLSSPTITHGKKTAATISGHLGDGVTNATGNVLITVTNANGVVIRNTRVVIDINGNFVTDLTLNWVVGIYTVSYHYAGTQNFNGTDSSTTLLVN